MSFSSDVKTELCRIPVKRACCAAAEAYGVLLYGNTFNSREIRIITGHGAFAKRLPELFAESFGASLPLPATKEGRKTSFLITDTEQILSIFQKFGFDAERSVAHHINLALLEDDCCRTAFIRGAFLTGGSVTDPNKRYHLELVTDHMSVSRETFSILLEMGFSPKDSTRKADYITYFKQSENIEDFLTKIGAPISAMAVMSAKIEKDMRNDVNRRVNCDTANADKVVAAAQSQLEAIRRIDREIGLENLPEKLEETALLRIANPDVSLSDLAVLAVPPVTKSCLSHRMRSLLAFDKNAYEKF